MKAECLTWKPLRRNTLLGFARIQLGTLIINDVSINASNGRTWANLPARPMLDKEGGVMRAQDGKIRYAPMVEWVNHDAGDKFSEAVVAAIEAKEPGALAV